MISPFGVPLSYKRVDHRVKHHGRDRLFKQKPTNKSVYIVYHGTQLVFHEMDICCYVSYEMPITWGNVPCSMVAGG